MKVTIIGGGNIGILMAAEISQNASVTVYSKKANDWKNYIKVYDKEDKLLLESQYVEFTDDLKKATKNSDIVFITYPSYMFGELSKQLEVCLDRNTSICVIPGGGGVEFQFRNLINKGFKFFGFQRVHSISRIKEYGESVYMLGRKDCVYLSSIPKKESQYLGEVVGKILNIPCKLLENYLSITLTPSNPILHTTRLYSMFKEWNPQIVYDRNILFYEEWTDDSSDMLIKCDNEVQELCNRIPLNLSDVLSLMDHYEVDSVTSMTEKISNIPAYKGLTSPMRKYENGFIPDFTSRYFVADFSYGLKVIKDIAELFDVSTPNINTVWDWYYSTMKKMGCSTKCFEIDKNITKEYLVELYS